MNGRLTCATYVLLTLAKCYRHDGQAEAHSQCCLHKGYVQGECKWDKPTHSQEPISRASVPRKLAPASVRVLASVPKCKVPIQRRALGKAEKRPSALAASKSAATPALQQDAAACPATNSEQNAKGL